MSTNGLKNKSGVFQQWGKVLRQPFLTRFLLARTTSRISTNLIPIIISWQVLNELHSSLLLTFYYTCFTIGLAGGSFIGGIYVDLSGPRKALLVSDVVRTVISALAFLLLNNHLGICLLGIVLGLTGGIAAIAQGVLPRKLLQNDMLHVGISLLQTIGQALFLIIPIIGTVVMKYLSSTEMWLLITILYGVSALQFLLIPNVGQKIQKVKLTLTFQLKESFVTILKDPTLYMFAVLSIVSALTTTGILDVLSPYVMVEWVHTTSSTFGLTMPLWGIGLMLGSFLSGFLRVKRFLTLVWTYVLLGCGFLLVVQNTAWLVAAGLIIIGIFMGYIGTATRVLLSLLVSEEILGRASGLLDTLDLLMQPVSLWGAELSITRKMILPFIAVCECIVVLGIAITTYIGLKTKKLNENISSSIG